MLTFISLDTVAHYIRYIRLGFEWAAIQIESLDLLSWYKFRDILDDRHKYYMKISSQIKTKKGKKDIHRLIRKREWPEKGIQQLQGYVAKEEDEWLKWVSIDNLI